MTTTIKELESSIELLLKEITEFKQQVQSLNECEENHKKLKNKKQLNQPTQMIQMKRNFKRKKLNLII